MRHLGSMGYITETGPDEYKPNNFSKALSIPIMGAGYSCLYVPMASRDAMQTSNIDQTSSTCGIGAGVQRFPEWAMLNKYKEPKGIDGCPFQVAYNTKQNTFEYMIERPPYGERFNQHMAS